MQTIMCNSSQFSSPNIKKGKEAKVIQLQARCGPEGG
jgi:hypothetical protein